jgi:hypothetical protein
LIMEKAAIEALEAKTMDVKAPEAKAVESK